MLIIRALSFVKRFPLRGWRPSVARLSKRDLVKEHESKAVDFFMNRDESKESATNYEEGFVEAVKKSPSIDSINFGVALAVEAGWHKALSELLSVDKSKYTTLKYKSSFRHPLRDQTISRLELPPASGQNGTGYVDAALLCAIVNGKVEAVEVMAKYLDVNSIHDVMGRPMLHYVYFCKQEAPRRQILDILLPKLEVSICNMGEVAKHGDLESLKYFVEKLSPRDKHRASLAAADALLSGQDDVAKWAVETPGIMDRASDMAFLIGTAVRCNNLSMIEYLSGRSKGFTLDSLGHGTASDLWAFLKREKCTKLFVKFVPTKPRGYNLWSL